MQKVYYSKDLDSLKNHIGKYDSGKIFVVSGNKSFAASGVKDFIEAGLGLKDYTAYSDFDPNPQIEDLKRGIALFKEKDYDFIIGAGGGSVIDMAKMISLLANQKHEVEDLVSGKYPLVPEKTPLLAIPTTAGAGAEATAFSVIYMNKTKYSVGNRSILPDMVYLSPAFSLSASPYLTAVTGLDAFSQAVEALWSVNANEMSDNFALEAVSLIWENLHQAVHHNEPLAKENMQTAAYLAGKAINITKTTAPHALSYGFTIHYNIPHGHAVALSLPYFFKYNYNVTDKDCNDKRGSEYVITKINMILNLLNTDIKKIDKTLKDFFLTAGINTDISQLINNFNPQLILNSINADRLNNNPRQVSRKAIENFLAGK